MDRVPPRGHWRSSPGVGRATLPSSLSQLLRRRGTRRRSCYAIAPMTRAAALTLCVLTACATSKPATPTPAGNDAARAEVRRLADDYVAAFTATFPEAAEINGLTNAAPDGLSDNSLAAN